MLDDTAYLDYENCFLAQIVDNNDLLYKYKIYNEYFQDGNNRKIILTIKKIIETGDKADVMRIMSEDKTISATRLSQLSGISKGNAGYYYRKLKERYDKYQIAILKDKIDMKLKTESSETVLHMIEEELSKIYKQDDNEIKTIKKEAVNIVREIEIRHHTKGGIPGLKTGFRELDNHLLGLKYQNLYIFAARPSHGKTAGMLNMACYVSKEHKTGIITVESPTEELLIRMVASETSIDSKRIQTGVISKEEILRITDATRDLYNRNICFYDKPNATLEEISISMRRMVEVHGVEVVFIDYLQQIDYGTDAMATHEKVKKISKTLKGLARKLNIPVVALAQLRRDSENRVPRMADIADSSQVEKDADGIIFIYHKKLNEEGQPEKLESWFLVEKSRNGSTGWVPVIFKKEYVKFTERELEHKVNKIKTDENLSISNNI